MKFGVYETGTPIVVDSSRTSNDNYNHKLGIVLSVTKNGWHTVLVEGSKIKLRTTELKEPKEPTEPKKVSSKKPKISSTKFRPRRRSKKPKISSTKMRRSLKPKMRSVDRSRTIRQRPQKQLPFLSDINPKQPYKRHVKKSKHPKLRPRTRRSIKKHKKRPPPQIPRRPKSMTKKSSKPILKELEEARKDAQNRMNYRKHLLFLDDIQPKSKKHRPLPQSKKRRSQVRRSPKKSKLLIPKISKKERNFIKSVLDIGGLPHGWSKQHHKKTLLIPEQEKEKTEQERIEKAKRDYQQYKLTYDKKVAEEEANRPRPLLNIGLDQYDPKSIDYSFETIDHMIQGNKRIKNMYIGDSRFYGHTDDGVVVDAELDKVSEWGLEEPKGLSVVFFWTDGLERNRLKFNFDSKTEFDDFYSNIYYEIYPDGPEEEEMYEV